ncbi:unnamed protein product [Closterium sp. NIES-65]|nr:unnamed protein product [Closterium sp. NIES-65]
MGWQGGDGMRGRGRGRGGGKGGRGYGGVAGGGAGGGGAERGSTAEQHAFAPRVLDPSLSQYFTEIATAWEDTPDPQDRASIAANALEEARGKEHQLLWDTQTCRTLEPLLSAAPPAAATRFLAGACCCARRRGEAEGQGAGGGGEGSGEREVNVCRDVLAHGLASRVIEAGLRNIRAWVTGESRTRGSAGLDENGAGDDENEEQDGEGEEEENEEETEGQGDLPKWTGTVRVVLKKICKEVTEYPLAAMTSPACSHVLRSLLLLLACRPIHDTPAAAEGTRKARRDGADSVGGEEKREQGGEEAGEERREGGAGRRFGGRLPPQIQRAAGNFPPSSGATFPGLPGMAGQGTGLAGGKEVGAAAGGAEAAAAAERGRRVGAALGFPALLQRVVVGVTAAAAGADEAVPSAAVAWSPYGDSWTLACDPSAGPLLQVLLDVIRDDAALLTHVITSLLHLPEAALRAAAKKRKRAGPGKQEGERGKKRSRREKEEGGEEGDEEEGRGGAEGGEEGEEADQQVEEEVGQIIELMKDRCGSRFMEVRGGWLTQPGFSSPHNPSAPRSCKWPCSPTCCPSRCTPLPTTPCKPPSPPSTPPQLPVYPSWCFQAAFFSLSPPSAPFPQAVLLLAPQSLRSSLLRVALLPHLLPLALHPIANYTVQTALSALHSPSDVKRAFKALAERGTGEGEGEEGGGNRGEEGGEAVGRGEGLLALLKGGRGRACDSLLAALSSSPAPSPVDAAAADAAAVGDLLWLDAWLAVRVNDVRSNRAKKRQQQQGWGSVPVTERGAVSFVGCMALQTIFSFPMAASQRVVQACVALPPSYLMHLATDVKGTRVLSAFFRAATVPLDLKTTMLNSLKPRLTTIAADRLGAFVVSAAFDAMTVEGKQMILAELATRYSSASSSLLQRPLFRHMSLAEVYPSKHLARLAVQFSSVSPVPLMYVLLLLAPPHSTPTRYLESPEAWQKQQQRKEGLLREFQDLLAPAPAALPSLAPAPPALPSASAPDAKPRKKKREPTVEVAASAVTKNTKSGKKRRGGGEGDEGEEGRHGGSDVGSRGGGKSGEALRGIVEQLELGSELAMLGFSGDGGEMGQDEMDGGSVSKKRKDKSAGAAPKKRGRV